MKRTIHGHPDTQYFAQQTSAAFDKDFFNKSKFVLLAMGVALLYCLGYGIVLYYEFKKMGVLDLVKNLV